MAGKAAEDAWVRHYSYILAAEPEHQLRLERYFENAVKFAGAKHLTADPTDPGRGTAPPAILVLLLLLLRALHASRVHVAIDCIADDQRHQFQQHLQRSCRNHV
jgi:hypothetical protein